MLRASLFISAVVLGAVLVLSPWLFVTIVLAAIFFCLAAPRSAVCSAVGHRPSAAFSEGGARWVRCERCETTMRHTPPAPPPAPRLNQYAIDGTWRGFDLTPLPKKSIEDELERIQAASEKAREHAAGAVAEYQRVKRPEGGLR